MATDWSFVERALERAQAMDTLMLWWLWAYYQGLDEWCEQYDRRDA